MEKEQGLRYNSGKTRYDLLPNYAIEQLAKVLTLGANKYKPRNWEIGMPWMDVIASLKRHLAAFERGEDIDKESNELHMAHVLCNAAFITEYYKIAPQFDNRQHSYLKTKKIGLDLDDVLIDFIGHWTSHHKQDHPEVWKFDRNSKDKFDKLRDDKEFWLSIPVKTKQSDIPFEAHCYITARSIPVAWTEEWLDKNGFAQAPVYSVGFGESKVESALKSGIDIFVDDSYANFVELNKAGICTYLFDATHNKRYDVGYKRIYSLKELI